MTQLSLKIVQCPKCGIENKIIYYASINTMLDMDGSLIARFLDGTLNTSKCHNCGITIRLSLDVLINCPNGMFYLNPTDDLDYKKEQFKTLGIISEKGGMPFGRESLFMQAKNKLNSKKVYKPSPLPPPAPKITPHTKIYNDISKQLAEKLLYNKKKEIDEKSEINSEKSKPPPPPPPPES